MRKIIQKLIIIVSAIMLVGYFWFISGYNGEEYFVLIKDKGVKSEIVIDTGAKYDIYSYNNYAYSNKGDEKKLEFTSSKNLRKGAYLSLTWNSKKGVTNWKEVEKSRIPKKVLKSLGGLQ